MTGLGTLVNMGAVFVGATVGMVLKGGVPKRFQDTIMHAVGLITMFIGLTGALSGLLAVDVATGAVGTQNTMVMVGALIIGAFVGELVDIEKRLDDIGEWCKSLVGQVGADKTAGEGWGDTKDGKRGVPGWRTPDLSTFVDAFVTSSLLYCVGAMTIVGALEDGLNHDYTLLFTKSVLDGIMGIIFAATLGFGVYFSILTILVYQGGITLLAGLLRPLLSAAVIGQMSFVGNVIIFGLGINLIFGKKIKVGNLLPAMFVPAVWQGLQGLLGLAGRG
ncbi:MAG: DUF554 domain-containing protein [Lachnospiraceae bacterium]|jgi:uncharacterized membrane protein YqgA involved in biofilm formation|nr:DUF554 domain-containing protein [Lachnospiraceae bacterium]